LITIINIGFDGPNGDRADRWRESIHRHQHLKRNSFL